MNITGRCNLDCCFCECQQLDGGLDLSFEELKVFFESMAAKGADSIFIGGGEPFLRKDIWDILSLLKRLGFTISMVSNGLLLANLSDEKLTILDETVGSLVISIDSTGPQLHNRYRNNRFAFEKVVKALKKLAKLKNLRLATTTIITKDNYKELPGIVEFAAGLGVQTADFQPFSEATNFPDLKAKDKKEFMLSLADVDELRDIFKVADEKARELGIGTSLKLSESWIFDYFHNKSKNIPIFNNMVNKFECILPFSDIYVRHNGDVQLCALVPKISSIREKSLDEVIKDIQKHREIFLKGRFLPECSRCFCGLTRNVRFSILAHPIINFDYLKQLILTKIKKNSK